MPQTVRFANLGLGDAAVGYSARDFSLGGVDRRDGLLVCRPEVVREQPRDDVTSLDHGAFLDVEFDDAARNVGGERGPPGRHHVAVGGCPSDGRGRRGVRLGHHQRPDLSEVDRV